MLATTNANAFRKRSPWVIALKPAKTIDNSNKIFINKYFIWLYCHYITWICLISVIETTRKANRYLVGDISTPPFNCYI